MLLKANISMISLAIRHKIWKDWRGKLFHRSSAISQELKAFSKKWNFNDVTSSPNFPRSNGLSERAVRSAKDLLRKCEKDNTDPRYALLLLRNAPRDTLSSLQSNAFFPARRTSHFQLRITHSTLVLITDTFRMHRTRSASLKKDTNTRPPSLYRNFWQIN